MFHKEVMNFAYHKGGAFFKPCRAFFHLHTMLKLSAVLSPGIYMYIYSSISPFTKALTTSICSHSRLNDAKISKKSRTVVNFTTGANLVYSKQILASQYDQPNFRASVLFRERCTCSTERAYHSFSRPSAMCCSRGDSRALDLCVVSKNCILPMLLHSCMK